MEILIKIGVTLVIFGLIFGEVKFVKWIWGSQIDPKATFSRIVARLSPETDLVATRDPTKIYVEGEIAGTVSGEIIEDNGQVKFATIEGATSVGIGSQFEYKRDKFKIVNIGSTTASESIATSTGVQKKYGILREVICQKIGR